MPDTLPLCRNIKPFIAHVDRQTMILIELGNSTIKIARPLSDDTLMLERMATADELLRRVEQLDSEIVCAPVGQKHSDKVVDRLRRRGNATIITREMLTRFIGASYDTPETLGIDRVLNLIGLGKDGVVVSCGTAITVDARIGGRPVWGAILPGFATAAEGLHARVPALPRVDITREPRLPARTSIDSVANGILIATAHGAHAIARELSRSAGPNVSLPITLTGGDAQIMERLLPPPPAVVDELVLFAGMLALAGRRISGNEDRG